MVMASVVMFIIATLYLTLHVQHCLEAYVWYQGPPIDVFANVSSWISVVKSACYVAQTFVGDVLLVRLFGFSSILNKI
jgi:capsule polysaccharide modification protein KpsS